MFHPVRPRRASHEALEQIIEAIQTGQLRVGERLPTERNFAAQMQISRTSVREGIKVLVDAGVLEAHRGGGTYVRSEEISPDLLAGRWEMRLGKVEHVLDARRLIEPRVAQLAAVHATDDDLEVIQRTVTPLDKARDDEERLLKLDMQFHLAVARATRNPTVVAVMELLLRQLEAVRRLAIQGPLVPEWLISIHERTLKAIIGRDPLEIEKIMDEHLSELERVWQEQTGRARVSQLPDFLLPLPFRQR